MRQGELAGDSVQTMTKVVLLKNAMPGKLEVSKGYTDRGGGGHPSSVG